MRKVLAVENLCKNYENGENVQKVLKNINIDVYEGEFIVLMGTSGSGKTTLLNCISTMDSVNSGRILINNKSIADMSADAKAIFRNKHLGFVFQDYCLLDNLTIYENIAIALTIRDEKVKKIEEKIYNMAGILGIEKLLKKYPYQLSGGEKQRVSVARALVTNPTILLADEPTGALDEQNTYNLMNCLDMMNYKYGVTIVMVTHDAAVAAYGNRVIFLNDGRIKRVVCRNGENYDEYLDKIIRRDL